MNETRAVISSYIIVAGRPYSKGEEKKKNGERWKWNVVVAVRWRVIELTFETAPTQRRKKQYTHQKPSWEQKQKQKRNDEYWITLINDMTTLKKNYLLRLILYERS